MFTIIGSHGLEHLTMQFASPAAAAVNSHKPS